MYVILLFGSGSESSNELSPRSDDKRIIYGGDGEGDETWAKEESFAANSMKERPFVQRYYQLPQDSTVRLRIPLNSRSAGMLE